MIINKYNKIATISFKTLREPLTRISIIQKKAPQYSTQAQLFLSTSTSSFKSEPKWSPILDLEGLPLGIRKEIRYNGYEILLFWYKNSIYAINSRSPAEGAYSEGFIKAILTQDNCIKCPSTGTSFSLKNGEIVDWYPNNPVLRILSPKEICGPLLVYPVQIKEGTIFVDLTIGEVLGNSKGGGKTSLDSNIYSIEPKVYLEGTDPETYVDKYKTEKYSTSTTTNSIKLLNILVGVAGISTVGTGLLLYFENFKALFVFWIVTFSLFIFYFYNSVIKTDK
jgi:nitrite reductase/ring-hydroxylating ferredoxin subunit